MLLVTKTEQGISHPTAVGPKPHNHTCVAKRDVVVSAHWLKGPSHLGVGGER
jgi:hypothetical protein